MANILGPQGFLQSRNALSAAPTFQSSPYQIAFNNANTFGCGDVVKLLSTGFIDRALTSDTEILGILIGVKYTDSVAGLVNSRSWTAPSTAIANTVQALVIDDPYSIFRVQSSNGGPVTQASVGKNINFASNAAPATSGISTAYADFATINTTSTLPFRISGLGQQIDDDPTTQYNWIEVKGNPGVWMATNGTGI